MANFAILSNRTRAALRPPLLKGLADEGLFLRLQIPRAPAARQSQKPSQQLAPNHEIKERTSRYGHVRPWRDERPPANRPPGQPPAARQPTAAPLPGLDPAPKAVVPPRAGTIPQNGSSSSAQPHPPGGASSPPSSPERKPSSAPIQPSRIGPVYTPSGVNGQNGNGGANGKNHRHDGADSNRGSRFNGSASTHPNAGAASKPASTRPASAVDEQQAKPATASAQQAEQNPAAQNAFSKPAEAPRSEAQHTGAAPAPLTLDALFARNPDLPVQAAVLGASDDGLPVLLDLRDPTPGAIAIIGDERETQLALLRSAITSAAGRSTPRALQFVVFSHQPETWQSWIKENGFERHCLAVEGRNDQKLREWIIRLADWTEQRRLGQSSGPPVLVIMDTLSFLSRLPHDVRLNFDWMVKEAPQAAIWPVAAISTGLALSLGARGLSSFQSLILGFARDPQVYTRVAGLSEQDASCFDQPGRFGISLGEKWLRFQMLPPR